MTSLEVLNESTVTSLNSIQSLWNERLRPSLSTLTEATATSAAALATTMKMDKCTSDLIRTPSSSVSRSGLTGSLSNSRSIARVGDTTTSSTETDLRKRAHDTHDLLSSPRLKRRSCSQGRRTRTPICVSRQQELLKSPSVCKPLFSSYLLQGFDVDEVPPSLTLVLDLDETLVCNRGLHAQRPILRPYCLHVLNALRHMLDLEIVLWTASTKDTATRVVHQLHCNGIIFDDIIFRNNLWFTEPVYTKNLRLLGRDMDRVLIVDNAANSCKLNPRNALLIEDFHGHREKQDAALVNVYYVVEALLGMAKKGISVKDGLAALADAGHLCQHITIPIPSPWMNMPLSSISPVKLPPFGKFVQSRTKPPSDSIMQYWTF